MNRFAIVISLVAVLLLGAAAGLLGARLLFEHDGPGRHAPWGMRRSAAGGPHVPLERALPRLQRLLDLTPEQVRRIEPRILETRREFQVVRDSLHSRIEAELTPAQIERWRAFERERGFPGPPPEPDRAHRALPGQEGDHR